MLQLGIICVCVCGLFPHYFSRKWAIRHLAQSLIVSLCKSIQELQLKGTLMWCNCCLANPLFAHLPVSLNFNEFLINAHCTLDLFVSKWCRCSASLLEQCFQKAFRQPQYRYMRHSLSANVHMCIWPEGQNPYAVHVCLLMSDWCRWGETLQVYGDLAIVWVP